MNRKLSAKQATILALLLLLNVLTVAALVSVMYKAPLNPVPEAVTGFLSEYLDPGYRTTYANDVFKKYFGTLTQQEQDTLAGESQTELDFYEIFYLYSPEVTSYSLEQVADDFVIVTLYDDSGETVPPPVGFWYRIDKATGLISDWRLGRLQPFSRYDPEYSEEWEGVS